MAIVGAIVSVFFITVVARFAANRSEGARQVRATGVAGTGIPVVAERLSWLAGSVHAVAFERTRVSIVAFQAIDGNESTARTWVTSAGGAGCERAGVGVWGEEASGSGLAGVEGACVSVIADHWKSP